MGIYVRSIYSALLATVQLGWLPPRGMSIVPCSCIDWCSSPASRETHAKECVVFKKTCRSSFEGPVVKFGAPC